MSFNNVNDFMGGSWSGPIIEEVDENATATPAPQVGESTLLQLPQDCLNLILNRLPIFEMWTSFAFVSQKANHVAQYVFIQQIMFFQSYNPTTPESARNFRREVVQELSSGDLITCECGWFYKEHNRLKSNLKTMRLLNERTVVQILKAPNIYHLEKTRDIVLLTAERLHQWDPVELQSVLTTAITFNNLAVMNFTFEAGVDMNQAIGLPPAFVTQITGKGYCPVSTSMPAWTRPISEYWLTKIVTPFARAMYHGSEPEVISALLNHGANPNGLLYNQTTYLHIALHDGNYDLALSLLENGASLNVLDEAQHTPFHFACQNLVSNKTTSEMAFINLLLTKYKADPYIADNNGETPAQIIQQAINNSGGRLQMPTLPPKN
jgi:ankyrin repeat protein/F-box associated protein